MNLDYTDEQKQLKAEARKFLSRRCSASLVRGVMNDPDASMDRGLWVGVAELGWLGAAIPEDHGGLGLGYVELCAIAEELGRAVAPVPFASTLYFCAEALTIAGSSAQQARWLPKLASGEIIGCMATAEGPGALPAHFATKVDGGRLSGIKIPVTDGDVADIAVVAASEDERSELFIVELADASVQRKGLESLDPARGLATLELRDTPAERLGGRGEGAALMSRVFDRAAVLLAFEQLGGADRCLEMARDYAMERYAFGRKIGSYQAIKHSLADMYVKNELARSNAYYAAWALNTSAAELPAAAAAARIAASDAFSFAARQCIQIHGGIGFTWEADPHLYYRRARQLSLVAGAPDWWGERLVAVLTSEAKFLAPLSTAA